MSEFLGTQGVKYIVGRPFTSERGEHTTGEELDEEFVLTFHYLEAFVNSGFLYRVYEEGYDRLPPHVFNAVQTLEEAKAKIAGDESRSTAQNEWARPKVLKDAEKTAEVDAKIHTLVLDHAGNAHEQHGYTDAELLLQKEQEQLEKAANANSKGNEDLIPPKKTATKKTAAKKA